VGYKAFTSSRSWRRSWQTLSCLWMGSKLRASGPSGHWSELTLPIHPKGG
jgi:hypothetical protein